MTEKVCAIEEIKERSEGEVLREVVDKSESLTVAIEDSGTVIIRPAIPLKPLPAIEGFMPQGWRVNDSAFTYSIAAPIINAPEPRCAARRLSFRESV